MITVTKSEAEVRLEGVKTPKYVNTVIGALVTVLQTRGHDIDYTYAMGVSGAAFRLQVFEPHWCPSSPNGRQGFDCTKPLMRAVGRELTWHGKATAADALKADIDSGHPCVYSREEGGLIVGYQGDGSKPLVVPWGMNEAVVIPLEDWTFEEVGCVGPRTAAPAATESISEAIDLAIEMLEAPYHTSPNGVRLACGLNGYDVWMKELQDDEIWPELIDGQLSVSCLGNAWMLETLADARACASAYLHRIAGLFPKEVGAEVQKAADLYSEIAESLSLVRHLAPYPWHANQGHGWTNEMRHAQAKTMTKALEMERAALLHLKAAAKTL